MNFDNIVLGPLYQNLGTDAVLTVKQQDLDLRVIDQTAGVELSVGSLSMPSVKPVAMCRTSDLMALGFTPDQIIDTTLVLNGASWTIKNVAPKPGPDGRASGEIMLILINGDL